MTLTRESLGNANRIRRYDVGSVTVNETTLTRTLLLSREELNGEWGPEDASGLTEEHLNDVLAMAPEVLILGTGRRQRFPERSLMAQAIRAGVGIEVMTTEAACRTYNVLAAEERHVVAVLFMIETEDANG